jgi:DNA-binding winged helix-turn-helix (wHTH) protein
VVEFPPYRLDLAEERLWRGSNLLGLRRKPFAILRYLAEHPGRLVTQAELLTHVWGNVAVSDSAVRSHLHELRQVLGDGVIETVIGRGYRFVAPIVEAPRAPDAADAVAAVIGPTAEVARPRPGSPSRPPPPASPPARRAAPARLIVGRDAELDVLRGAVARAATGGRQVCFVLGDPGIGKTTLVDALVDELEDAGDVIAVRGQCVEQHGAPEAYLPVIGALGQLRRSTHGDAALAALWRHAPGFLAQLPYLVPDDRYAELTQRVRETAGGSDGRTTRQLALAIEQIADAATVVLVLEDLQWTDVATVDLVALLAQRREPARIVVIATARRAELAVAGHPFDRTMRGLVARAGATALILAPLAVVDTQRYLDARFPGHALPAALAQTIDRITGGTPLFVASFVDDLAARGMITASGTLARSLDEIAAHRPETVTQMIDLQIDRLEPDDQRTLEAAAVVGAEVATGLVEAALGTPAFGHDERLDELARRGLFVRRLPSEDWPDGTVQSRFGFSHALVREVCLRRNVEMRRQRWHRSIAERLVSGFRAGPPGAQAAAIAAHYDQGQVPAAAVSHYAIAAERTQQRHASRDALALYRRALELLRRLPETAERDAQELGLLFGAAPSSVRVIGEAGRDTIADFERMVVLAERLGDPVKIAAALINLAVRYGTRAYPMQAIAVSDRFRATYGTVPLPPALAAFATASGAMGRFWMGELRASEATFDALTRDVAFTTLAPGTAFGGVLNAVDRTAAQLFYLAMSRWCLGRGDESRAASVRALELADHSSDPFVVGMALCNHARVFLSRGGRAAEARACAERVLALPECEVWHTSATLALGSAKLEAGELTAAEVDGQVAAVRGRMAAFPLGTTFVVAGVVEVLHAFGRDAEAAALLDEGLAFAAERGERVYLPELLRLRGELCAAAADPIGAAAAYHEAIERARAMGAVAFELRAALALAALWHGTPRAAEAVAIVAAAVGAIDDPDAPDVVRARALVGGAG